MGACVQVLLCAWGLARSVAGACQQPSARTGWEKLSCWHQNEGSSHEQKGKQVLRKPEVLALAGPAQSADQVPLSCRKDTMVTHRRNLQSSDT